MKVLVTGANGFIGKNLGIHLQERANIEVLTFLRSDSIQELERKVEQADFIFHLAGVNRPLEESEFAQGNTALTQQLCAAVKGSGRPIPILYSSSVQAEKNNAYGVSKRQAEDSLCALSSATESPIYIYRLPNVFGKWCRPNYNSVVATFCHNIVHDLPIEIHDPEAVIQMAYVDDVLKEFLYVMDNRPDSDERTVSPIYSISIGELAAQLQMFKESRATMLVEPVGTGLTRALYSTYISYFRPEQFFYSLIKHEDARGRFVEMLKTKDSGQFSYFTAHPGVTRGDHYHHSKTEKFLVIKGEGRFNFRHIITGDTFSLTTSGQVPQVVETIPGWAHNITNIGNDEMVVMLWANEVFDRAHPDTVNHKVEK